MDKHYRLTGTVEMIVRTSGWGRHATEAACEALDTLEGVNGITVLSVHVKQTPNEGTGYPR